MKKFRLERKTKSSGLSVLLNSVLFAGLALVFCEFIIAAVGFNPLEVYGKMFSKAFLSARGIRKAIESGLPLMLCGLGVSIAFRMNLNNIGAEGQYAVGAIFGAAFVLYGPKVTGFPGLVILAVCCFAGGALWALLCAFPKAYWGVDESITTLMLNYVALILLSYLCLRPWKAKGQNVGQSEKIPDGLQIPEIAGLKVSMAFPLVVVIAVLLFLFYKYTTSGYQLNVIGKSLTAARYAGINIKKNILLVLGLSGGLAGLAGFVQYAGITGRVQENMPNNAGYTAIVIAYLSRFNPLVVLLVSFLFAGLQNSSATVQVMGVPAQIATMMQGAIMVIVIAGDFFQRYKIVWNKNEDKKGGRAS